MTEGRLVLVYIDAVDAAVAQAVQYIGYDGIEGPRDDDTLQTFRERVAGALRERGMVIEAHEVIRGRRWDAPDDPGLGNPESVLTGVAGHLAIAMHRDGVPFSRDGVSQVGDELAAGTLATVPDPRREAMGAMIDMLGPAGAVDMLDGLARR